MSEGSPELKTVIFATQEWVEGQIDENPGPEGPQGPQGEQGPAGADGAPGSDADVTTHEAAENPHPQYFHRDQPIMGGTSTEEGDSMYFLQGTVAGGQYAEPYSPTNDPEVEGNVETTWMLMPSGFQASNTSNRRPIGENPNGYYEKEAQEVSLTSDGLKAGTAHSGYSEEEGYFYHELAHGTSLKFQSGISDLALPVTGELSIPETLATQEWVQANSGAPSLVEVTITDGTEVTELGTLNKWAVTAPVTLTLPEVVEGAGHLVYVDFLDRITWPAGTEVHGDTEGLTEAWLSLVGDDGHWTVLVSSSGEGGLPEGMRYYPDYVALQLGGPLPGSPEVTVSPNGFEASGDTGAGMAQIVLAPEFWMAVRHSEGGASGLILDPNALVVMKTDESITLLFPEGESYTALPEEGTDIAPHTLATREWVEAQDFGTGGGSGGIQSIVAGDNVTVDSTDPANPVISSQSGGGHYLLPMVTLIAGEPTFLWTPDNQPLYVKETT